MFTALRSFSRMPKLMSEHEAVIFQSISQAFLRRCQGVVITYGYELSNGEKM